MAALGRAGDLHREQLGGALAVGGDVPGQLGADVGQRGGRSSRSPGPPRRAGVAAQPVGQREHRVVGAHVVVDDDVVEARVHRAAQRPGEDRRRDGGVGADDGDHRRHLRGDHPRALGEAEDASPRAAEARATGDAILGWVSVVRIASAAGSQLGASDSHQPRQPGGDLLTGSGTADDAGDAGEDRLGRHAEHRAERRAHARPRLAALLRR